MKNERKGVQQQGILYREKGRDKEAVICLHLSTVIIYDIYDQGNSLRASNYIDGSLGRNCDGVASSINHLLQYQGSIMHADFFVYISLNSIMQSMDCIIYDSQPNIFRQVCFGCNASF